MNPNETVNAFSFKEGKKEKEKRTIMEMVVVVVAAPGFYMCNLSHVHLCQMALPKEQEIIFAHHLHQFDAGSWAAAGYGSCLDMVETMGFVMGSVG